MILLLIFLLIFLERTPVLVFLGNGQLHAFRNRPLYVDVRISPGKSALIVGMVEIGTFVSKLAWSESTRKPWAKFFDEELLLVLSRKQHTEPFSIGLGAFSQIDCHIINLAGHHAHQLVLG